MESKKLEEIKNKMNDTTRDFLESYYDSLTTNDTVHDYYIGDLMHEFADSRVNIYYSDIEEYYKEHMQESSNALIEYGYELKDFDSLEEAMHRGSQMAQYQEIYNDIEEDLIEEYLYEYFNDDDEDENY